MNGKKLAAEAIGTFWLTFGGCGSAVIAAGIPQVGIGMLGVALAFGLTLLTMAYAIGHVSGCHLNPAVTVGLTFGGRFPRSLVVPYVVAQVDGAIVGAAVLYAIASGSPDFNLAGGFAANGYGDHSPGKYDLGACALTEVVLTMMFLFRHHGRNPRQGADGICANRHRPCADPHSSDQHPRDQYFCEPGAQHRTRAFRGRLGAVAALVVLGGAIDRGRARRLDLPVVKSGADG